MAVKVQYFEIYKINEKTLAFDRTTPEELKEGEVYQLRFEVIDGVYDDYDEHNTSVLRGLDNYLGSDYHAMVVVKYVGNNIFVARRGFEIEI